jgi:hypothetical protein
VEAVDRQVWRQLEIAAVTHDVGEEDVNVVLLLAILHISKQTKSISELGNRANKGY